MIASLIVTLLTFKRIFARDISPRYYYAYSINQPGACAGILVIRWLGQACAMYKELLIKS